MTGPPRQGVPSVPAGHARNAAPPVHQALFGYDAGHRLLASSTPLDPATESALSRLTDGTGATDVPGFDGHLAGYPLPGGAYALSRTWTAPEIPRPGAVWTHVLLLDRRHLGASFAPAGLAAMLTRPGDDDDGYARPLDFPEGQSKRPRPLGDGAPDRWREALSALFESDKRAGSAWLTAQATADAEPALLALWQWLWPALRRSFAFSAGATGARRTADRPFDLLVVPAVRQMTARADLGPPPEGRSLSADLIADDLAGRLPPSFGDFCRFCGAETASRSAAAELALAWRDAVTAAPGEDAAAVLRRLATSAADRYPAPSSMRRYKRALVHPDRRLPAAWTADDAVRVLATTRLALAVAAQDVDVASLTAAARDPQALALAAGAPPRPAGDGTAAAALPAAADLAIRTGAGPDWLPAVAAHAPATAAALLDRPPGGGRTAWARAFWALPEQDRDAVADPGPAPELSWLPARAPRPSAGERLLAAYCAVDAAAVTAFANELAALPDRQAAAWTGALADPAAVAAVVGQAPGLEPAAAAALLAALSPSAATARSAGLRPWRGLALSRPPAATAAHALLLAPSRRPNKNEIVLAARSFAVVWDRLSKGDPGLWALLGAYPSDLGAAADWDRSRRVAHRFAATVVGWDRDRPAPDAGRQAVAAARRDCQPAADQLAEELAKADSGKRSDKKKSKKRDRSMIEQVVTAFWPQGWR